MGRRSSAQAAPKTTISLCPPPGVGLRVGRAAAPRGRRGAISPRSPPPPTSLGTTSSCRPPLDLSLPSPQDAFRWLRARDYVSVGTALHASRSTPLHGTALLSRRLALWVGNEANGLSEAAIDGCDRLVHIPMAGLVESLNVGRVHRREPRRGRSQSWVAVG